MDTCMYSLHTSINNGDIDISAKGIFLYVAVFWGVVHNFGKNLCSPFPQYPWRSWCPLPPSEIASYWPVDKRKYRRIFSVAIMVLMLGTQSSSGSMRCANINT